jgi:predicted ABC-type transport system involved in lysophospholipase L1 biosynthesis ATPase subunit
LLVEPQQSCDAKTTLVLVTHDPQVAALAHRKIVLRDGLVVEDILCPKSAGTYGPRA